MPKNFAAEKFDLTIEIDQLGYDNLLIFDSLKLDLKAGSWTCLLGVSGIGKSTLLKFIAGLVGEQSDNSLKCSDHQPIAGRISYMAQQDLLLPWLTVFENVTLGDRLRGVWDPIRFGLAHELIDRVGLRDYAQALPKKLSGGMRQRVALARTLLEDKALVLMDEPFSALDAITRLHLQEMASELLLGRTVLLVTHDPLEALRLGNNIFLLEGCPASLEQVAYLDTPRPREVKNPEIQAYQGELLARMSKFLETRK